MRAGGGDAHFFRRGGEHGIIQRGADFLPERAALFAVNFAQRRAQLAQQISGAFFHFLRPAGFKLGAKLLRFGLVLLAFRRAFPAGLDDFRLHDAARIRRRRFEPPRWQGAFNAQPGKFLDEFRKLRVIPRNDDRAVLRA